MPGVRRLTRLAALAASATLGGWLAAWMGVPLAWLVGSMLVTAAVTLCGVAVDVHKLVYRAGQIVVAVAVGLTVSADVAVRIVPHMPLILAGALVSVAVGRLLSPVLARWGGMSPSTAHFSMVPAGISEMAELAGRRGADVGAVATFHTLRVMMVVILLPLALLLTTGAADLPPATGPEGIGPGLFVALALGLGSGVLASRIGMPSGFFVAPMLVISMVSGGGLVQAQMPGLVLALAQIGLGMALGARFDRVTVARLPRALAVGLPVLVLHGILMAAVALAVARMSGFDPLLLVLGLATGGTAEMVLTAKIVAADAAMVAVYQVTRGLAGNLLADVIHRRTILQQER